jgi:Raf kinase inhibitor-like YbhB/YbcL family protein
MKLSIIILLNLFLLAHFAAGIHAPGGGNMKITSPDFKNNELIPKKFTCDGENVSPCLVIESIPPQAKNLALIIDDPDAPMGTWVHWVVYDIPPLSRIEQNSIPGKQGMNDFGRRNYGGPCPPSGTHRYFFKIFALDAVLELKEGSSKKELERSIQGHILEKAELVGLYKRAR